MSSPIGLHRVVSPRGVLPQAAERLDASPALAADDELRVLVERLNLDAASFRQLRDAEADVPAAVLRIIRERGKMHNPVTGSGGMLIGVVDEVGPASTLGFKVGDRIATLVSLTLTPLQVSDGLRGWDGRSEQVPCEGTAILFGQSSAALLPEDLDPALALAVFDVCGAPALTDRIVKAYAGAADPVGGARPVTVAVLGGAGKSGSLALAAARGAGARTAAVVVSDAERDMLTRAGLADHVAVADARDPIAVSTAVAAALGGPATVTVVCVDVPGCEHGAILATADGGTVIFFSMATSFAAAALGAEGLAADVTMLVGNGYVPGHAAFAVDLVRRVPAVRSLFETRIGKD
jgi:L-erythro-3,5-diaminohexanoate dehydrogenase